MRLRKVENLPIRRKFSEADFGFKHTHREKVRSNKTLAIRKSTNVGVWAVGTLNQLFIRGS